MSPTMTTRKEVSENYRKKYKRASKKRKSQILDEVVDLTGWCRKHAAGVMRGAIPIPVSTRKRTVHKETRGRKPKYSMAHKKVLKVVWATLDFASSRRVVAGMVAVLDSLEKFGHITLAPSMRIDMETMSASTMDTLLSFDRKSMSLKGRSTTKPGALLKSQIPIRRGSDWMENKVGFVEIDLVAHCGHSAAGEFVSTLDMTDVKSTWTVLRAVRNKARVHTVQAIKHLKERLPFKLLGIDSDNGSEFINEHLLAFCDENDLVFTRGRPNTKNDGCFIEQKNWSVARRFSGYYRFEGQESVDLLNKMYDLVNLHNNFFMPSQKLISTTRDGAHVSRKHDGGKTPYQRIMEDADVPKDVKAELKATFEVLDVLELRQKIGLLQEELKRHAVPS